MCDPLSKGECVPTFARESKRGPFVSEVENAMRNDWGQSCGGIFADFFSSADSEGPQRTGKCMYIKARWNKRDFAGSTRPCCDRGREDLCFAVCALVCDFSPKAEGVPAFACESKRGPFVREVETAMRNGWGTALVAATLPDLI